VHVARTADLGGPDDALAMLKEIGGFDRLVQLPEAPREWRFRTSIGGPSRVIDVELADVLRDWLHGAPMPQIGDRYLSDVPSEEFRIEQIVDAVTQYFEHFLAWTIGAVIELANAQLAQVGADNFVCPSLPLFVRYGVDSGQALELLTAGVRSREFAKAVADEAQTRHVDAPDLRRWIRGMSIAEWRNSFNATAADVLDLLEYTRTRRGSLLQTLLQTGLVEAELEQDSGVEDRIDIVVRPESRRRAPRQLVLHASDGSIVSRVPTRLHADVQAVLDTGLDVRASLVRGHLRLALAGDDA
jgi:hypothetical protein